MQIYPILFSSVGEKTRNKYPAEFAYSVVRLLGDVNTIFAKISTKQINIAAGFRKRTHLTICFDEQFALVYD